MWLSLAGFACISWFISGRFEPGKNPLLFGWQWAIMQRETWGGSCSIFDAMNHSFSSASARAQWRWLAWAGLAGLVASALVAPGSVSAQGDGVAPVEVAEAVEEITPISDYHYEAPKGSNLTYLARRSLQLENGLTSAELVAAETCVVQALGADDLIFVNQPILVEGQVMADCLEQTNQLTEAELDCWARYLPIREDLSWITPTQVVAAELGVGSEAPGELPEDVAVNALDDATDTVGTIGEVDGTGESSFTGWYWWIVAGFVFGLGWYFFVVGRSWRKEPEALVAAEGDDKKVSQSEVAPTPVDQTESDSQTDESKSTSKKNRSRRRRSTKN